MSRRRTTAALIAVNAALLGVLGFVSLAPSATAQDEAFRRRGAYAVVTGEMPTGNDDAIYVTDTANQELLVVRWNTGTANPALEVLAYRDLAADSRARVGR